MKKWKLLLGAIGTVAPLAISTPFIVGCSSDKKKELNIETPTKFVNIEVYWEDIVPNYRATLNVSFYKEYENGSWAISDETQVGSLDLKTKKYEAIKDNIFSVKQTYLEIKDAGYTPILLYSF